MGLSTLDVIMSILVINTDGENSVIANVSLLRMLRVLRMARMLRIIRVVKFFRDLRVMVSAIVSTFKVAGWAVVLLMFAIYLFGTALAQLSAEEIIDNGGDEELLHYFGSLPRSLLALYMTVAGGCDWENAYWALYDVGPAAVMTFMIYILFASFCVMNVIIGIFCHNAAEAFEQDLDKVMESRLKAKKTYVDCLVELFHAFDDDGSNIVSLAEFEQGIEEPKVQQTLRALDIERRDALALFSMLDEKSAGVNIDEFVTGCINLRGQAKTIHVEACRLNTQRLTKQVDQIADVLNDVHSSISRTRPTRSGQRELS